MPICLWVGSARCTHLVQRDALTSDDESDESDDGECGDLASKYNELASKYNELARFPFIITGSENDISSKRCKLFI